MLDYPALLKSLGLNDSETKIYLVSLELGPAPAQMLVKRGGFSRPSTYVAIESLVTKGLMSSQPMGKRHLYTAEPPDRLVAFAESQARAFTTKVQQMSEAVEGLRMMQHGERPTVKFYEGVEGLKAILHDLVTSNAEKLDEIANIDAMRQIFSIEELKPAQAILNKKKMKGRALLLGNVSFVRPGVEARLLPKNIFNFQGDILIYGDKIAMVTYTGKIIGAVIENNVLADTYRGLFDLAWKGAQDFPQPENTKKPSS